MIMNFLKNRLKERSTWLGIVTLATLAGVSLSPEQKDAVVSLGVALAAAISVFTADTKPTVVTPPAPTPTTNVIKDPLNADEP